MGRFVASTAVGSTALLTAVLGVVAVTPSGGAYLRAAVRPAAAAPGKFTISGSVTGLYPGARQTLTLTLTNGNTRTIRVRSLTVTATAVVRSCGATNLTFGPRAQRSGVTLATDVRIAARSRRTYAVAVTMARTAPEACRKATFALRYAGKAIG